MGESSTPPECPWMSPPWVTLNYRYKDGAGFGEWWDQDWAHNIYQKMNYDFVDTCLYLYPAFQQILPFGIIDIEWSGKFLFPELSQSGQPLQILQSMHPQLMYCRYMLHGFRSISRNDVYRSETGFVDEIVETGRYEARNSTINMIYTVFVDIIGKLYNYDTFEILL